MPSNIHAALQQATVLGDIYVALDRPADQAGGAPRLAPGATIPITQTTSPPQLEDTIAIWRISCRADRFSAYRTRSSVSTEWRHTGTVRCANSASRVAADLADLSDNLDTVDQWLNGVRETTQVLHDRLSSAEYWFSPRGMTGFERATISSDYWRAFSIGRQHLHWRILAGAVADFSERYGNGAAGVQMGVRTRVAGLA